MGISIQVHPDEYEVQLFPDDGRGAFAVVKAHEGDGRVSVFLPSPAACDELIKAAAEAKRLLLAAVGEPPKISPETIAAARQIADDLAALDAHSHDDAADPWTSGAHEFIPCTTCTTCTADACNACDRPAGDAVHRIAGDSGPEQVQPDVSGGGVPYVPDEKLCAAPGHVEGSWCIRAYDEPHMHEDAQGRKWGVIAGDSGPEQAS